MRTNGINPELRAQYQKFFRHELSDWITEPEQGYSSFRGGVGTIFPHYRGITTFFSDAQMIEYIDDAMNGILKLYNAIASNPDGIFNNVVCMNSRNEGILTLVKNVIYKDK